MREEFRHVVLKPLLHLLRSASPPHETQSSYGRGAHRTASQTCERSKNTGTAQHSITVFSNATRHRPGIKSTLLLKRGMRHGVAHSLALMHGLRAVVRGVAVCGIRSCRRSPFFFLGLNHPAQGSGAAHKLIEKNVSVCQWEAQPICLIQQQNITDRAGTG